MNRFATVITSLLMMIVGSYAQPIYTTDSSMVSFFSSTPMEDIEAFNTASTSLINVSKKDIVFRVPISGFIFDKPLMQEHFNENYMETEKYPYASFKGKLSDTLDLTVDTVYRVSATGVMNMHGVDQAKTYEGIIECKDGLATLKCEFSVPLKEHRIKVPKVVFANIAEDIDVNVFFQYKPYEKKK